MKGRRVATLMVGLAAVIAAAPWLVLGERRKPVGQPALARIDFGGVELLKHAFNAAANQPRILVLLSPTGGTCVRGASALQRILDEVTEPQLWVFIVWEPVLRSDVVGPTSLVLGRVRDLRARQFWDPAARGGVCTETERATRPS